MEQAFQAFLLRAISRIALRDASRHKATDQMSSFRDGHTTANTRRRQRAVAPFELTTVVDQFEAITVEDGRSERSGRKTG